MPDTCLVAPALSRKKKKKLKVLSVTKEKRMEIEGNGGSLGPA